MTEQSAPSVDPAAVAEEFFRASAAGEWDAALAVTAPGMVVWQSGDRERVFAETLPRLERMRARAAWHYRDVRRLVAPDGFCEQHVVRFTAPDGSTTDYGVCAVGRVDASGRLTRLDEYVSPIEETT